MKISQYLKQANLSLPQFAQQAGVPYQTLYTTVHRPWIVPSADLALRIIEASGGEVTLPDLVVKSRYARRGATKIPASPELGQEIENRSDNGSQACG